MNRLALVLCGDLSETTGGFIYDSLLMEQLQDAGWRLEVVSLPWRGYGLQLAQNFDRFWHNRLRALEADIVLQDELCHPALVGLNRWALPPDAAPRVAIVHHLRSLEDHPSPLAALYRWIESAYLRTLDGFIFNSRHTRDSVRGLVGPSPAGVVAYPGRSEVVPEPEVPRTPDPGRPVQLLFVGGLTPRKGLHTLLQALVPLGDEAWRLHVVGREDLDPGYAHKMRQLALRPGHKDRVRFHGQLPRAALLERYRRAHLLVVPSQLEGFGMVYLEAMGFGLPVVATARGGAQELVDDGRNGYLVPPGSPETLARILRPLLQQPQRLAPLAEAARARYQSHPTWEDTGHKVLVFLGGLLQRKSGRSGEPSGTVETQEASNPRRTV